MGAEYKLIKEKDFYDMGYSWFAQKPRTVIDLIEHLENICDPNLTIIEAACCSMFYLSSSRFETENERQTRIIEETERAEMVRLAHKYKYKLTEQI